MKAIATGMTIMAMLFLHGCANRSGFVQMYEGAPKPPTEIGFVKGIYEYRNGSSANETIRIVSVDGQKVPNQFMVAEGANIVSLPPGTHDIKVLWVHAFDVVDFYTFETLTIQVMQNCVYQIYSKIGITRKDVEFQIVPSPASMAGNQNCGDGLIIEKSHKA